MVCASMWGSSASGAYGRAGSVIGTGISPVRVRVIWTDFSGVA